MQHTFAHAKWIANPACPADAAPIFCRRFLWQGQKAQLVITGLGFYTLAINGQLLEDTLLDPPFTRYDISICFQEVDITSYLQEGENEITVTLGNGWYNEQQETDWQYEHAIWKGTPRMLAALWLDDTVALISDSQWQTAQSATLFNSLRCGETYDARWQIPSWQPASIVPSPGGELKRQTIEPISLQCRMQPVAVLPQNDNTVYDFGVNTTGNVEICVEGESGATVELQYAEDLLSNGFVSTELIGQYVHIPRFQKDIYILAGTGRETWHSHFGYNGYRYVRIRTTGRCTVHSVQAREFHTNLSSAGEVRTSHESLAPIQAAILRSSRLNFHHIPTDCPHREKNGWTGDAWLSARQMCRNFDMRNAYTKWLDDIVDAQRPSGQIPCIVPTSAWGYEWGCGITWDIALIAIPWEMYMVYGDVEPLRRYAEPITRYLRYLWTMLDDGIPAMGLGDWTAPAETPLIPEGALRAAMAVYACQMASSMAEVLENDALLSAAQKVGEACEEAFLCKYGDLELPGCQLLHALRLRFGLTDDVEGAVSALLASLEVTDWHILGGIFTARFVPEALSMIDRKDILWKVITAQGYPGWADLASRCAGTFGEDWHGGMSMNHHMYSSVGVCFYEDVAGIELLTPGGGMVRISPYIPADLPSFSVQQTTVNGIVSVGWEEGVLRISLPHKTSAELCLGDTSLSLRGGDHVFSLADYR